MRALVITGLFMLLLPGFLFAQTPSYSSFKSGKKTTPSDLQAQWNMLADSIGGCTVAGEYYDKEDHWNEGCCFDHAEPWKKFNALYPPTLSQFLIDQLADTAKSEVHICPFSNATKGELAVYLLQRLHRINWYELDPIYAKYADGSTQRPKDFYSLQAVLQRELADRDRLRLIRSRWQAISQKAYGAAGR